MYPGRAHEDRRPQNDSMERRYNIVDTEDLSIAKELLERRMKRPEIVTKIVTIICNLAKPGDTADSKESTG